MAVENGMPAGARIDFLAQRELLMKDSRALRSTAWKARGEIAAFEALHAKENFIPDIVAGAGAKAGVMLDIAFPAVVKAGDYRIDLVQRHRGVEIGRLTIIVRKRRSIPVFHPHVIPKPLRVHDIERLKYR
jgi:hypothetical protein